MLREQATRFEHFESYSRLQHYSVTTDRFGLKAELVARVHRDRIKGKSYEVISRVGSPVIQSHVFDALLEAEVDTSKQGGELLTRENYTFHLTGQEEFAGRKCYVIETEPKHKEKRLLKGKLWVDAEDFGLVHVEEKTHGEPFVLGGKADDCAGIQQAIGVLVGDAAPLLYR